MLANRLPVLPVGLQSFRRLREKTLYIDFARVASKQGIFPEQFTKYMHNLAALHNVDTTNATDSAEILDLIVQHYSLDNPIVVLIDEYDRPLVERISQPEEFQVIADVLKDFYVKLKSSTDSIHQCIMTGITEFGKLSIFSGANQFVNISLDTEYATCFGYIKAELEANFAAHIDNAQRVTGLDADAWWEHLRYWYNGYSWNIDDTADDDMRVYCPFTVLSYLRKPRMFINYWAQSGTTSLLAEIIKAGKIDTIDLENTYSEVDQIMSLDPENIDSIGLLFQTGYLTLTSEKLDDPLLISLGFPNREIKTSINKFLLSYAAGNIDVTKASSLRKALKDENWDLFFSVINTIMASISYEIFHRHEHYAHSIIHTILSAASIDVISQLQTSCGRIDILIKYSDNNGVVKHIIIELKTSVTNGTTDDDIVKDQALAQTALAQIRAKGYADAFGSPVIIGAVSNTASKKITAWVVG